MLLQFDKKVYYDIHTDHNSKCIVQLVSMLYNLIYGEKLEMSNINNITLAGLAIDKQGLTIEYVKWHVKEHVL